MKITRSTTKEQLVKFIGANVAEVKKQDKNLFDQLSYADKQMKSDPKKVTKTDLVQLAKDVAKLLGDKCKEVVAEPALTPVVENSVKPAEKKAPAKLSAKGGKSAKTKKTEETTPAESESEPEKKPEAPKTEGKKNTSKKDSGNKPAVKKPVPEVVGAESFPETLTVGDETYTLAHDITDMETLHKAFSTDEEILFAFYWSKSQIKQFNYGNGLLPAPSTGFADNLDLTSLLYVSDEKKVCYSLSMYTENLYQVMPQAFEEIEGVRYSMGIEFQIYRK